MAQDTLFLIQPDFEDPAYPGRTFYCWHCALLEGVLAGFPGLLASLDVVRVPWPHPRTQAVKATGQEKPSLPLLLLATGERSADGRPAPAGRWLIDDKDAILAALSKRHGFPEPHP